ncbi:MAG: hypothetical protein P8J87_12135 [Verrucomicrobiales bacterium]|nr:hypothetical protein [Verrucomicrobiales bacterium]
MNRSQLTIFSAGVVSGVVATLGILGLGAPIAAKKTDLAAADVLDGAAGSAASGQAGRSGAAGGEAAAEPRSPVARSGSDRRGGGRVGSVEVVPEADVVSRFAVALAIEDRDGRRAELQGILKTWVTSDHEAALAMVEGLDNVALRRDLTQFALTTLSDESPATAVALLKTMPSLHHDQLWERSFLNWVADDPEEALEVWQGHRHPEERREALKGIAVGLAQQDTGVAIEWANGLSDPKEKREAVHQIVGRAMRTGHAHAAQYLDALAAVDRNAAVEFADTIAQRWADQDPREATEWAESLEYDQRNRALREIAHKTVHRDPAAAEGVIDRIDDGDLRRGLIADLGRLRITAGVQETARWIGGLSHEDQQAAWRGASAEWARSSPQDAAVFALSGSVDEPVRQQLIDLALPQWSRIDPAAAAEWAADLPGDSADGALQSVVEEWSASDPVATIDFLANSVQGEQLEGMTKSAVKNWSHADPSGAAAFIGGFEEGAMKDNIASEVTKTWMEKDSLAASEWVASLDSGSARDSAVVTLIHHIARDDVDAAVRWAETIGDRGKRDDTFERLLRGIEGGR